MINSEFPAHVIIKLLFNLRKKWPRLTPIFLQNLKWRDGRDIVWKMNDFILLEQVGQGAFGRVFKARHKLTKELSAAKVILLISETGEKIWFESKQKFRSWPVRHRKA